MSSATVEAIALFLPVVASNAIFAPRRMSKGMKAFNDDKKAYGLMNFDIAAGQTFKGLRAVNAMAIENNLSAATKIENICSSVKTATSGSKVLSGLGKVVKYTSENINPIIIAAGGVKVLTAEDKIDAFDREAINLGCMFGAEAAAKKVLGMPILKNDAVTGKLLGQGRKSVLGGTTLAGRINKLFGESQKTAISDLKTTKMFFDKIPAEAMKAGLKGAFFVTASILGYKIGECISDAILGKEKSKTAKVTEQVKA